MIDIENSRIIFNKKIIKNQLNSSIKNKTSSMIETSHYILNFILNNLRNKDTKNLENLFLNFNDNNFKISQFGKANEIEKEKNIELSLNIQYLYNDFINQDILDEDSIENNIDIIKNSIFNEKDYFYNLPEIWKKYILLNTILNTILLEDENKNKILNDLLIILKENVELEKTNSILKELLIILINLELNNDIDINIINDKNKIEEIKENYQNFSILILILNYLIIKDYNYNIFYEYCYNLFIEFFNQNVIYEDNNNFKLVFLTIKSIINKKNNNIKEDQKLINENYLKILKIIKYYDHIDSSKLIKFVKVEEESLTNFFKNIYKKDGLLKNFYENFLGYYEIKNYFYNEKNELIKLRSNNFKTSNLIIEDIAKKLNNLNN